MSTEKRPSILLVEDEENLHEALKLNLEMEGYEVTSCFNGNDALKAVQNEYFDLIIMDIMLPGIDGISITENIRVQQNEVPILILSAKNTSADRVLGLKKGADDYLTKPFNLEELLLRVEKLIDKNKKMQVKETVGDTYEFSGNKINLSPCPQKGTAISRSQVKANGCPLFSFFAPFLLLFSPCPRFSWRRRLAITRLRSRSP